MLKKTLFYVCAIATFMVIANATNEEVLSDDILSCKECGIVACDCEKNKERPPEIV